MKMAPDFYMLRHGETTANRDKIATGWLDVDLTDLGRAQAQECRGIISLLDFKPSIIVHSALSRTYHTAKIVNADLNLDMVECAGLNEQFFGDWQGQLWTDIRPIISDIGVNPPHGETQKSFVSRIWGNLNACLSAHASPPLFVLHGGIFEAIGLKFSQQITGISNCALYSFKVNKESQPFPFDVIKYEYGAGQIIAKQQSF